MNKPTVDPEFTKYIESLNAMPPEQKTKIRDGLLKEAGLPARTGEK